MWPFRKQKNEERAAASGFTAEVMAARESYVSGSRGIGELTATVQSCISLWEHGLSLADVDGTDVLDVRTLALAARGLATRGEALFIIDDDELVPASDWDVRTRNGRPSAYRVSVSESGGGRTETALAGEVLHFRIGADPVAPWLGTAPLRRAPISAELLHVLESALRDVYETAPLGTQVLPFPESPGTDLQRLGRDFRGRRGSVLLRESVNVTAAGGPAPAQDWRPNDMTPDLQKAMTTENLTAAKASILSVFNVLPALLNTATTGPLVREAQRHLAQWQLQPIAAEIGAEVSDKLGVNVTIDTLRPLQAFDSGGRARSITALVGAMAQAKEAGLSTEELATAFRLVDWTKE